MRHKAYQGLFSMESIYLISWISMRIGRSDTRVFSYIEEVYRYNREKEPDFYEVHGHTIDPVTGQALSLNDFFTSVEALPSLIFERMDNGYMFPLPVGYSSREVLGIIAASYGGNFVISDDGQLLLIRLSDLPRETNYLITEFGDVILFGTDRILV